MRLACAKTLEMPRLPSALRERCAVPRCTTPAQNYIEKPSVLCSVYFRIEEGPKKLSHARPISC